MRDPLPPHSELSGRGRNSHPVIDALLPAPNQKAALVGSLGTPSLGNPYVTQAGLDAYRKSYVTNPANTSRVQAGGAADIANHTLSITVPAGGGDVVWTTTFVTYSSHNTYGFHYHLYRTATLLKTFANVLYGSNQGRRVITISYLDKGVAAGSYTYLAKWAAAVGTGHTTYISDAHIHAILTGPGS